MATQLLPNHEIAEMNVLASILINQNTYFEVVGILGVEDFFFDKHKNIFSAMQTLANESKEINIVTLSDALQAINQLDPCGGIGFLMQLAESLPTACNAVSDAKAVKGKSTLRKIYNIGQRLMSLAVDGQESAFEEINNKVVELFGITTGAGGSYNSEEDVILPKKLAEDLMLDVEMRVENPGMLRGISMGGGFPSLDKAGKGCREFTLIGAKTGRGKTMLALNLAIDMATKKNIPVLYINLEMNYLDLGYRILSKISKVAEEVLSNGGAKDRDWPQILHAIEKISNSKLIVTSNMPKDINAIVGLIHKYKIKNDIQVVIIDYMMEITHSLTGKENHSYFLGGLAETIKHTCSKLGVAPIVINQLNSSGDIANSKILEHKASLFVTLDKEENGQLILNVRKNRGGKAGFTIPLYVNYEISTIQEAVESERVPF